MRGAGGRRADRGKDASNHARGTGGLQRLGFAASAGAAKKKHHTSPATYKVGTYKGKLGSGQFSLLLKRAQCAGKLQLCVSLPVAPQNATCSGPVAGGGPIGPFTTVVPLPSSGNATEQTPLAQSTSPNGIGESRQSGLTVTFTKKGTASGYFELNQSESVWGTTLPCVGKVPFTAKLG